jgi:CheY-like chemotaxis protein
MSLNSAPKRIVLVEDNPSDVFLLRRALEEYGVAYTLELVRDGEQALKYLDRLAAGQEPMPDLVVLDLNLPRHDGLEVLASCRRSSTLASLPILILTSSDSPMERERAEELGVSDYVRKPIMLDEFMAVGGRIRILFEGRSAAG